MKNLSQLKQDNLYVEENETISNVGPTDATTDEELSSELETKVENEDSWKPFRRSLRALGSGIFCPL